MHFYSKITPNSIFYGKNHFKCIFLQLLAIIMELAHLEDIYLGFFLFLSILK